jgi:hypothetical protein
MSTNLMDGLRVHNTINLIESFNYPSNDPRGYIFIGKPTPWINDREPPLPQNDVKEMIEVHNQMLSLVRIEKSDAFPMIKRKFWTQNIVYDYYRDDISYEHPAYSGATTLKESNFYIINSQNDIYVCLNNNNNSLSENEPLNRSGDPFVTADGYQWLLVYSLNTVLNTSYSTDNWIPVIDSYDPRIAGEINTVIIENRGSDYTDFPEGVGSRVRAYYCNVIGDGTGAVAKVHVDGTSISKIEMVRRGSGYRHATLEFRVDKVYKTLYDLDNELSPLNPEGNGDLRTRVIISPPAGWRMNLPLQLIATDVGVFSKLDFDTDDFVTDIEFRQVGILQDPVINIADTLSTLSAMFSIKTLDTSDGVFYLGEEIYQSNNNGVARGTVMYYNKTDGVMHYYQDYDLHNEDGKLTRFTGPGIITGLQSSKSTIADISFSGKFDNMTYDDGYAYPELDRYSGNILYLSNIRPVRRNAKKAEKLVIIVNY